MGGSEFSSNQGPPVPARDDPPPDQTRRVADSPTGGQPTPTLPIESRRVLAAELGGDLPCVRCRYNLRGLSIRSACPECALPVRATLLAMVDPRAGELQPVTHPHLTAWGLLLWPLGALIACICIWILRLNSLVPSPLLSAYQSLALIYALMFGLLLSALGGLTLIRPHANLGRRGVRMAWLGSVLYVPLLVITWQLLAKIDATGSVPYRDSVTLTRIGLHAASVMLIASICVLLSPNFRVLVARSVLMRTGRAERQTLPALAAVIAVSVLGDVLSLAALRAPGPIAEILRPASNAVVLVCSLLFTAGLLGLLLDCWRLRGVIAQPPLALESLLNQPGPGSKSA